MFSVTCLFYVGGFGWWLKGLFFSFFMGCGFLSVIFPAFIRLSLKESCAQAVLPTNVTMFFCFTVIWKSIYTVGPCNKVKWQTCFGVLWPNAMQDLLHSSYIFLDMICSPWVYLPLKQEQFLLVTMLVGELKQRTFVLVCLGCLKRSVSGRFDF